MSAWGDHLVYLWRRCRGRCWDCGKGPPLCPGTGYCQSCHEQHVEAARQIIRGLQGLEERK